jgi:hypothetical protein
MPWGNVTITGQDGQDIYVDGNYEDPAGKAPGPFVVTYGKHTFETLKQSGAVECSGDAKVNAHQRDVTIALLPVV